MTFPTRRTMTFLLPANSELPQNISGSFLAIISSSASFGLSFDNQGFLESGSGFAYPGGVDPITGEQERFASLRFKETSGLGNIIKIAYGDGVIVDNRAIFGGTNVPVEEVLPSIFSVPGADIIVNDNATALAFSGNANDVSRSITNHGAGTVYLNTGAATETGIPVRPGETVQISVTSNVYVRNQSGVQVRCGLALTRRA